MGLSCGYGKRESLPVLHDGIGGTADNLFPVLLLESPNAFVRLSLRRVSCRCRRDSAVASLRFLFSAPSLGAGCTFVVKAFLSS